MMLNAKHSRRATTITEAAIVFGVIALLTAGVWAAYNAVHANLLSSKAVGQLTELVQNMRFLYKGTTAFADEDLVTTENMVKAGVFPAEMLDGSTPKSPWGTDVDISAPTERTFSIEYLGLSEEACRKLASSAAGKYRDQGLKEIVAGSTHYDTAEKLEALPGGGFTNSCASGDSVLSFEFSLK